MGADRPFCDVCGVGRSPAPGAAPPPGAPAPATSTEDAFAPVGPHRPDATGSGAVPPPYTPPGSGGGGESGEAKEKASPALVAVVGALAVIAVAVGLFTVVRLAVDSSSGGDSPTATDDGGRVDELASADEDAWDPGFKRRTIAACMTASQLPPDDARSQCTCIFDELEETMTYGEVLELDQEIADDPTTIPHEIEDAALRCA